MLRVPEEHAHRKPAQEFLKNVDFYKRLREGALRMSRFPDEIDLGDRILRRPPEWSQVSWRLR